MEKKKFPVVSIIFYVLSVLLFAYAIWALSYSINYVSDAIAQNQLIVEGFEFEIASFYMSNAAQYVVFAAVLFGIGWILQKMEADKTMDLEEEDDDEELYEEMMLEEGEEEQEEEAIIEADIE